MTSVSATRTISAQSATKKTQDSQRCYEQRWQRQQRQETAELDEQQLIENGRLHEYMTAANPTLSQIPVLTHPPSLHTSGPTRIIPFDLSQQLRVSYPATSPNLLASFLRVREGESLTSQATATSQAFYVIRGSGLTSSEFGTVNWSEGDVIVLPATDRSCEHHAISDAALYWVSDEPLLRYLGVRPSQARFSLTVFRREQLRAQVEELRHEEGVEHRNRLGVILGNQSTEGSTLTLTHTLWALLNVLPARSAQRPHRHNSVALDMAVEVAAPGQVYTLMGPELDEDGWVKNPVRLDWEAGGVFVTPPGWWHSHHNDSDSDAWVFPMQDAGLYTYQRTLDIQFAKDNGRMPQHQT